MQTYSPSVKRYVLPAAGWFVRDQVDDVYKLLLRKLAAFENMPVITAADEQRMVELFEKFIATKRKGDAATAYAQRVSESIEHTDTSHDEHRA